MKKTVSLLLILAMVFSLTAVSAWADAEEPVTLHLYGTANFVDVGPNGAIDLVSGVEMPGYNELIGYWKEDHPNVDIVVETCPWDNWMTSIQTAVLSGDVDIILHGATLTELCQPLNDYLAADPEYASSIFATENRRFENLDEITISGIQYVIEPSIAYVDKEILEHYGVALPDASWTWDDLIEIAKACTGTDPVTGQQTYGVQLCYTNTQNIFQNYYQLAMAYDAAPITYGPTAAESTVDVTGPKMVDIFTKIQTLAECCAPNVREGVNVNMDIGPDNDTAIRWRTLAYDQYRKADAAGCADRFAFIPLPVIEEGPAAGSQSTYLGSYNMAIANNSKNKDVAWEFIKWMTTDPKAVEWTVATGGIPNCDYGMQLLADKMGEAAEGPMAVLHAMPENFCNTTNENYDNVNFGVFSTELVTILKDLVYGSTTPDTALAKWQKAIDEYMATIR